jgi:predicted nuclease of restriction endonuclease-like RecB superfamily
MLTSDLSINYKRGGKIFPYLIKTDDAGYLRDAENLIEIFEDSISRKRGEIESELEEFVGTGTNYKILRGFIKLLNDRSKFDTSSVAEPFEIRQKIFLEAGKSHPIFLDSKKRIEIFQVVAEEFETDSATISRQIFSDLSDNQKLIEFETISPKDLLERYNLAQAQAILYRCLEMKIRVLPSDNQNYRAIFGWIKHFGLIHSVIGNAVNGYEITLTGAASLFHRSQKYGIQMSVFLPALLLCKDWKFSAEISEKKGKNVFYELSSEQNDLTSCYFDEPEYVNSDIEKLKKSFEKSNSEWSLQENKEVLDLGKTAFVPDFVLISPENKKVYLDVLGFWTPKTLLKRLEEYKSANFKNFIFAAGKDLRGTREEPLWESPNVLFYKTSISVSELEEIAKNLS